MKKTLSTGAWVGIAIGVVAILAIIWGISAYNNLVSLDQTVSSSWGNVQAQYQRRIDLVPNLVETVKGYATHEDELFTKITELRSQWQTAKTPGEQMQVAQNMDGALDKLMVVVENYPDLKASQNFLALQDQLEGTENRISTERTRYNDAVKSYNTAIKRFPTMFIANFGGFAEKQFFESQPGAETAPKVTF